MMLIRLTLVFLLALALATGTASHAADTYGQARQSMVQVIEANVQQTSLYLDREALDPRVMEAMATVPRHEFVPRSHRKHAYKNRPLPIGHGQTISQPYIVAIMTDLIKPKSHHRILEVGTGSGYQAAILAELVDQVYSIEIIKPLAESAKTRLARLGYDNARVRLGDGYYGWEEHAPFDAIVVTAAASHIPPPLLKQLKPGGRMIIPVGSRFMVQQLVVVEKDLKGKFTTRQILPVRFVPFTGKH